MSDKQKLPPEDGWKTRHEIIEETQATADAVDRMLREGTKTGAIEVFQGTKLTQSGVCRTCYWYRVK